MGEKPDLSGKVTTFKDQKIGNIALWKNNRENEKQPEYTGTVSFYNGEKKFKIAIWKQSDEAEEEKKTGQQRLKGFRG